MISCGFPFFDFQPLKAWHFLHLGREQCMTAPDSTRISSMRLPACQRAQEKSLDGPGCCYQFVTTRGPIGFSTSCILAEHSSQCILNHTSTKVVIGL